MKTLSITMEESLLKSLDQKVKEFDLAGRSEAIREAVRVWLGEHKLKKKISKEIEGYQKNPVQSEEFEDLLSVQEWPS